VLSHELRTPLTPVLSTVQAMESEPACRPTCARAIDMIRRNVELEARLIDDLLDLTRISKGKLELHLQTVDAHETLATALDICRSDILDKGLGSRSTWPPPRSTSAPTRPGCTRCSGTSSRTR
jgi:signal transduction histidine kinase